MTKAQRIAVLIAIIGAAGAVLAAVLPPFINGSGETDPPAPLPYTGYVWEVQAESKRGIESAQVSIIGHPEVPVALTDSTGLFTMRIPASLAGTTVQIAIAAPSYRSATITRTISSNAGVDSVVLQAVAPPKSTPPPPSDKTDSGKPDSNKGQRAGTRWAGLVTDEEDKPVAGAVVTLVGYPDLRALTSTSGAFVISTRGAVTTARIRVTRDGFQPWEEYVSSSGGVHRIRMERAK